MIAENLLEVPIEVAFKWIDEHNPLEKYMEYAGYKISMRRIRAHRQLQLYCQKCGIKATHYVLRQYKDGSLHLDLFAGDIMLTIDHITPKAKGGKDWIYNYQIMCEPCNFSKGAKEKKLEWVA
jgi:hypothetical protein